MKLRHNRLLCLRKNFALIARQVAECLLLKNADVTLEDEKCRDASYYAETKGYSSMIALLNTVPRNDKKKVKGMHALLSQEE